MSKHTSGDWTVVRSTGGMGNIGFTVNGPRGVVSESYYKVVCPTCKGSGSGDGFGFTGAGGRCADCRGTGAVLPTKAARITRAAIAKTEGQA